MMSEYYTLESSIRLVMNESRKKAVKEAAKDDEKFSKKDDEQDTEKTGQETQPDATMPTPTQTQTDKDVKKSTEGAKDGKADKIVLYPKIGESVNMEEATTPMDHKIGDTVRYHIGTSDHLKSGKIVHVGDDHLHVKRDRYKYHVPKSSVVHNERLQEAAFKNERTHAAKGFMSPEMAKHLNVGMGVDYYRHGTGDKTSGTVIHKSDQKVSFRNDAGPVHHYTIKAHEDLKEDYETKTPYALQTDSNVPTKYAYRPTYTVAGGQKHLHANGLHSLVIGPEGGWTHYHTHSQAGHTIIGTGMGMSSLNTHLAFVHGKQEALSIQPNLSPSMGQQGSSLPTTESTGSARKVGDIVKPKIGPHAGQPHKVIHVFGDGKVNITPHGLHPSKIKYHMGAVGAYAKDLE
jgi:hypothetical protein